VTTPTTQADTPPPKLVLQAGRAADLIRTYLREAQVDGTLHVDHWRTFDASVGQTYDLLQADVTVGVKDGHLRVNFDTSINGGDYRQQLDVTVSDASPLARITSQVRDVLPSPALQPQLARYFPGNTVFGAFNRTQDVTTPFQELVLSMLDGRYQPRLSGNAVTITTDGELEGQAAPKSVTAIFPGLNLTKYRYNKMTAFAEYSPDGSAISDMIFAGRQYDIYMEGVTDAGHIARYHVGLILLGSPQAPEMNHQYKLGRLLLFTVKARIADGKLYDQEVSYPWPDEALSALFIKNNPVYRLWVRGGK
jgi:hypothetical protein